MAKARWRMQRRYTANIYASAFVIATSAGICLSSLIGESFGSAWATTFLIALIILITLAPIVWFSRDYNTSSTSSANRKRWWKSMARTKPRAEEPPVKPWKRRRTSFRPTPHGTDHHSTFIPERPGSDAVSELN
jgi:MFS family permease